MRVERVERAVVSLVRYKNKTPSLSFFLAAIKSNVRGESASQVLYLPAALSFGDPVFFPACSPLTGSLPPSISGINLDLT